MQKLYTGTLIGIEPRANGWHRFHVVVPGLNYPVKLETKLESLIRAGHSLVGQQVSALADESESTSINPNSGKPYINRTLQNIAPAGQLPQPAPQPTFGPTSQFAPAGAPQFPAVPQQPFAQARQGGMDEATVRRITWLSAVSTAASLMQNMIQPGSDPAAIKQAGPSLFAIADAIYARARQVERGTLEQPEAAPPPDDDANPEWGQGGKPATGDDDVPF